MLKLSPIDCGIFIVFINLIYCDGFSCYQLLFHKLFLKKNSENVFFKNLNSVYIGN